MSDSEIKTYAQGMLTNKKFEYHVVAYNDKKTNQQGLPVYTDSTDVSVTASSEQTALTQARELVARDQYEVFRIVEIP
ncbi:hypothetical protein IJJ08_03860 [bacterium]|nr:hypothetical protein [bacterium]